MAKHSLSVQVKHGQSAFRSVCTCFDISTAVSWAEVASHFSDHFQQEAKLSDGFKEDR